MARKALRIIVNKSAKSDKSRDFYSCITKVSESFRTPYYHGQCRMVFVERTPSSIILSFNLLGARALELTAIVKRSRKWFAYRSWWVLIYCGMLFDIERCYVIFRYFFDLRSLVCLFYWMFDIKHKEFLNFWWISGKPKLSVETTLSTR